MIVNEIKINGRTYKATIRHTPNGKAITSFGLNFYNGKDKDGKGKYAFVNCTYFNEITLADKQDVVVNGYLTCNEWTDKQGNKRNELGIIAKTIDLNEKEEKKEETDFINDEIPF